MIPVNTLMIPIMTIPAHVLMRKTAQEVKTIPAKVLLLMMMMMIYKILKLVTCNYLQSAKNTMLNMMTKHYEN